MAKVAVGKLSDFPANKMKKVTVENEDILIVNLNGKLYAMGDVCTHEECSLSEGVLEDNVVACPCHYAQFDVKTGKVLAPPAKEDEPTYEVKIVDEEVFVVV